MAGHGQKLQRRRIVAANWRCGSESAPSFSKLLAAWKWSKAETDNVDVVVCTSSEHVAPWKAQAAGIGADIQFSVMNCNDPAKAASAGAGWVVLGASKRWLCGETFQDVAAKVSQAQEARLKVILCVGDGAVQQEPETLEPPLSQRSIGRRATTPAVSPEELERLWRTSGASSMQGQSRVGPDSGQESSSSFLRVHTSPRLEGPCETVEVDPTLQTVLKQLANSVRCWDDVVIAYEPRCETQVTQEEVANACLRIRAWLRTNAGNEVAGTTPILLVAPANLQCDGLSFLDVSGIDGFLIDNLACFERALNVTMCWSQEQIAKRERTIQRSSNGLTEPQEMIDAGCSWLRPLNVGGSDMFDVDLYSNEDEINVDALKYYFDRCREAKNLIVTTSCFAVWMAHKKTNAFGKVIPAIPSSADGSVRVFFFDDNIGHSGERTYTGICDLRDMSTGAYVDFSEGVNGFKCQRIFRHTLVHYSADYRVVLVQANIFDAMFTADYFSRLVKEFSKPDEKIVAYVDVNGTVLMEDSVSSKGPAELLLSTMFRLLEAHPEKPITFAWASLPPVELKKTRALKDIVRDVYGKREDEYKAFWNFESCLLFIEELSKVVEICWTSDRSVFSLSSFRSYFETYLEELQSVGSNLNGIAPSWFRFSKDLQDGGHVTILNSFGVDTHKVVSHTVKEPGEVKHITINYGRWSKRDLGEFEKQFSRP